MTASGLDLRVQPYKVAPDTHVIPQLLEAPPIGLMYVIRVPSGEYCGYASYSGVFVMRVTLPARSTAAISLSPPP